MSALRTMTIADYDAVINLMQQTPGVTLREADSREAVDRYLNRNPGLSLVAEAGDEIAGCIMAGHDGRRGYLQHLVVAKAHRHKGLATQLVNACLDRLEAQDIRKSHIDVLTTNAAVIAFWEKVGWHRRTDIVRLSVIRSGGANA